MLATARRVQDIEVLHVAAGENLGTSDDMTSVLYIESGELEISWEARLPFSLSAVLGHALRTNESFSLDHGLSGPMDSTTIDMDIGVARRVVEGGGGSQSVSMEGTLPEAWCWGHRVRMQGGVLGVWGRAPTHGARVRRRAQTWAGCSACHCVVVPHGCLWPSFQALPRWPS